MIRRGEPADADGNERKGEPADADGNEGKGENPLTRTVMKGKGRTRQRGQ